MEILSVSGGGSVSESSLSSGTTSLRVSADEEFERDLDALSTSQLKELLHRIVTANEKLANENKLLEEAVKESEQSKSPVALDEKGGPRIKTSVLQSVSVDSRNSFPDISESNVYLSERRKSRFRSLLVESQPVLSVKYKCHIASQKLNVLKSILENLEKSKDLEVNNLKAKLEELSIETAVAEDEKYLFNESIRIKGKHPITKRVMAEKVRTHFENSIKKKLILTERLRMQVSFDKMLRKKVISEMEEKRELFKNLDEIDVDKVKNEHKKCSDMLKEYNRRFLQLKARSNRSIQVLTDFKKLLDKEISKLSDTVKQIAYQERLKKIMKREEFLFYHEKYKLDTYKKKIMGNPRRNRVPGIMEYVQLNAQIKEKEKVVLSWRSKVAVAEQVKFLHLSSQRYP